MGVESGRHVVNHYFWGEAAMISENKELQSILDRLIAEYHPQRVIMFGSHAWGTPHEDSDVDLFIVKDTAQRFLERCFEVRQLLTPVRQELPLDIIVMTPQEIERRKTAGDPFITQILEEGTLLYEAA